MRWGLPRSIKVDNGRPLGDPGLLSIPPLGLWLIGLGIQVIWNRPATPTDNAKVERMQGVSANWSEPNRCNSPEALQQQLDQALRIQRTSYPTRVCGFQTRLQTYPMLEEKARPYSQATFEASRVWQFLSQKAWTRRVNKVGQVELFGTTFSVGAQWAKTEVSLKLDPDELAWVVYNQDAGEEKRRPANYLLDAYLKEVIQNQRTFAP